MANETHSAIPATKAALKTIISTAVGSVQATYGDAGDKARSERVWLGATDIGDDTPVSMAPGRRKLQEEFTTVINIEVTSKYDPESSETRVFAIAALIEDAISLDHTLGGVENLLWCLVDGKELDTSESPDSVLSTLEIRLRCVAQLGRA